MLNTFAMSKSSDVGISPVLLQAISQSLNSSKTVSLDNSAKMSGTPASTNGKGAADNADIVAKIISDQQEAASHADLASTNSSSSDQIKKILKLKMAANALSRLPDQVTVDMGEQGSGSSNVNISTLASDLAMANVLTAFATQAGRTQALVTLDTGQVTSVSLPKQSEQDSEDKPFRAFCIGDQKPQVHSQKSETSVSVETSSSGFTGLKFEPDSSDYESDSVKVSSHKKTSTVLSQDSVDSESKVTMNPEGVDVTLSQDTSDDSEMSSISGTKTKSDSPFLLAFNPTPGTSSEQNIIDMSASANTVRIIEHNGKRYIIQMQAIEKDSSPEAAGIDKDDHMMRFSLGQDSQDSDSSPFTNVVEQEVVTVGQQQESSAVQMPPYKASMAEMNGTPCPVCGDAVSGFHYGIFTCESCKGFFKRTVQNKKTFQCPRQGECEITLDNRKKCPACRFAKCLVMGMKLEAIRLDRTRGGRSSYGGSSPFEEPKKKRPVKVIQQRRPSNPQQGESTLVSVLSGSSATSDRPFVPQILTDIMNLESLLSDDDIPANISVDDFSLSNPNVFMTLLQLCELKLYKIVRWARNLPYFANISTDDQILLLQNCWCELLALTMCWKSLHLSNEIIFFHGQSIDQEKADMLHLSEMFAKMLAVVDQLKRLKLDQYEYVALKVIILICPDIKGLSDELRLSEQQQKVSIALEQYISSHYPQSPCKYGEMLLRLPELSRISCMMKDQLVNWMPTNTTSCGLLYELLKGENMKDLM